MRKKLIEDKLTEYFGSSDAFYVSSISEYLEEFTRMSNIMVTILTLIAGISLVVGGIGIMNIMLVSVTERTKEIGIRKALGAKERYILAQFVIEAGVTSALGGLIGIALGYLLSAAASQVIVRMFQQQMRVQPFYKFCSSFFRHIRRNRRILRFYAGEESSKAQSYRCTSL